MFRFCTSIVEFEQINAGWVAEVVQMKSQD